MVTDVSADKIIVDQSAEENGLALMLADLLSQNLEQHPEKNKHFRRLKGSVCITAKDAEVALTLVFEGGSCRVLDGAQDKPKLSIETDSEAVLGLSTVPLRAGLPDIFDKQGRAMLGQILSGKIKIKGLLLHPLMLIALTNVFSVN
jgi:hypothetical protein